MAYSTSNPPRLVVDALGGPFGGTSGGRQWLYVSADAAATVDASGYFTNGVELGMRVNDLVWVVNTASNITTLHQVSTASGTTVDVNDLTTITQTDSD